jgi:hypothetical protein
MEGGNAKEAVGPEPGPDEAPAARARRLRRLKFMFVYLWIFFLGALALVMDKFDLFSSKFVQVLFGIGGMVSVIAWAFWKISVPCPRCGWNLYLSKERFPAGVIYVPSICPNCGLDLETPSSR